MLNRNAVFMAPNHFRLPNSHVPYLTLAVVLTVCYELNQMCDTES